MSRGRKRKRAKNKRVGFSSWQPIFVLLTLGFIAYLFYPKNKPNLPVTEVFLPSQYQSFGIDISHHQEDIDWEVLFNDARYDSLLHFVYFKVSEGTNHEDQKWMQYQKALITKGIHHGAYHFFLPHIDAKVQALNFIEKWKKTKSDLPPVIDAEIEDDNLLEGTITWLKEVEAKTGKRPIIYTSSHLFEKIFKHSFKQYNFWIAGYTKEPKATEDPRVLIWQYSDQGRLPGIRTAVDLNYCKIRFD